MQQQVALAPSRVGQQHDRLHMAGLTPLLLHAQVKLPSHSTHLRLGLLLVVLGSDQRALRTFRHRRGILVLGAVVEESSAIAACARTLRINNERQASALRGSYTRSLLHAS